MRKFKAGMYAWGGPGTIRLLKTKYHSPKIDSTSFLTLYDEDRLKQAKTALNVTDVWVTFSWGFSEQTEKEDYQFITKRLNNFQKLNLRTHAYVQGPNVVTSEFSNQNIFCQDIYGRKIPYSKGRSLTCPCNPAAVELIKRRVKLACEYDFDGVFIDNILFGFPPTFVRKNLAPFFGCFCDFCKNSFKNSYGYTLPKVFSSRRHITDYLSFRKSVVTRFIKEVSEIAHHNNKYFGVNLFDPFQINSEFYQGYSLNDVTEYLDYYFIENHFLSSKGKNNRHLSEFLAKNTKPLVVISYDQGIGFESEFTSKDYDYIKSEANQMGYIPCYKVSEFTTNGIWHTLDFSTLKPASEKVNLNKTINYKYNNLKNKTMIDGVAAWLSNFLAVPLVRLYFENKIVNAWGHKLYKQQIRGWKKFKF